MTTSFALGVSLDTAAAAPLRQELLDRLARGAPLRLDGAKVRRIGLACLQVLIAARAAAAAEGLAFAIVEPSDPLRTMATLAGLDAVLAPAD